MRRNTGATSTEHNKGGGPPYRATRHDTEGKASMPRSTVIRWMAPVLGLALLGVVGCSGDDNDQTEWACDDFAKEVKGMGGGDVLYNLPPGSEQRIDLAKAAGKWGQDSDEPRVAEFAGKIGEAVNAPASQWQLVTDSFAQACFDAGWDG